MRLTEAQVDVLLAGIKPSRVKTRDGNLYVESFDIRAMMNRVFGFAGWSLRQLHEPRLLFQQEREIGNPKRPGYAVCYLSSVEIVIHTPDGDACYSGTATGLSVMGVNALGDAHDTALKASDSGALKRAATNLGDQFGLSLYNNGSLKPIVQKIVGYTPSGNASASAPPKAPQPSATGSPVPAAEPALPLTPSGAAPTSAIPDPEYAEAFERLTSRQKIDLAKAALSADPPVRNVYDPAPEEAARLLIVIEQMVAS